MRSSSHIQGDASCPHRRRIIRRYYRSSTCPRLRGYLRPHKILDLIQGEGFAGLIVMRRSLWILSQVGVCLGDPIAKTLVVTVLDIDTRLLLSEEGGDLFLFPADQWDKLPDLLSEDEGALPGATPSSGEQTQNFDAGRRYPPWPATSPTPHYSLAASWPCAVLEEYLSVLLGGVSVPNL